MSQETIARILSIEHEAVKIHDDAQRQAVQLTKDAEAAANAAREQALTQTRREAEQIIATGREAAAAERARIMAQAEEEAQRMETTAGQHFDRAVRFALNQVAARE